MARYWEYSQYITAKEAKLIAKKHAGNTGLGEKIEVPETCEQHVVVLREGLDSIKMHCMNAAVSRWLSRLPPECQACFLYGSSFRHPFSGEIVRNE